MSLKKGPDDNWQGFQKVDEPQDFKPISSLQPDHLDNLDSETGNKKDLSKNNLIAMLRHKEKGGGELAKNKLGTTLPQIEIDQENLQKSPSNDELNKSKPNLSLLPLKKPFLEMRVPRVPIVKHEEDLRFQSTIVYKGFAPKSSDSYIRTLKDINFQNRSKDLKPQNFTKDIDFNSKFEGGNLNIVVGQNEYDLYMRVDTNTRGHRQWFYFSVKSRTKHTIKLNIYRFRKSFSLFQRGMKPYVRSAKSKEEWKPGGTHIKYLREKEANQNNVKKGSNYFYLSFQYQFQHDEDEVFFAAGIPYTYSFLSERLLYFDFQAQKIDTLKLSNQIVGKSMCGLDVRLLKIYCQSTDSDSSSGKKRIIVINARSHSGEASSSWVLDGILDALTKEPQKVAWIKSYNLCFYILPMLNVDGVFVGNYRTGIVGDDFNRKFASGRKEIFPQIFYLKKVISIAKKEGNLLMFMDLHGHSILKNSFIYGPSDTDFQKSLLKKLPFYLWHKSKYFKMSSCKFKTEKQKIETARMYFQMKENILSFTCENSLGLYGTSQQSFQMTKEDWQTFGMSIVQAIKATMETEKQSPHQEFEDEKEDLRQTQIPSIKQSVKPLTAPKLVQPYKVKTNHKQESSIKHNQHQSSVKQKTFESLSKIFLKTEEKKKQDPPESIFNIRNLSEPRSIEIKTKLNEIRQRFPSLTSKQQKSKEVISNKLKSAQKNEGRMSCIPGVETPKNSDGRIKSFVAKIKHSNSSTPKEIEEIRLKVSTAGQLEKNEKKEFLQSIYHKKELKQLKNRQNQCIELGKNLTPSSQIIKQRLQKKNKTFLNQNYSYNVGIKGKKYSCDISSQDSTDHLFDNVQISLKDIRAQRSITFDQSYLAAQIMKVRQMKETEREYYEESEIDGWDDEDDVVFEDNFSQKFEDSINDEDSCDQDLPQNDKKYVIDYIRTHQNVRRQKMMESSSSDDEKEVEEKPGSMFGQKKRIHGFREISFKSVCNESEQNYLQTPQNKLGSGYATNSKIRKNPHKFQESLSIIKYKSFSRKNETEEKQSDSQLYITHKKRLNERSLRRDSRKDPFTLVSIKEKMAGKIP